MNDFRFKLENILVNSAGRCIKQLFSDYKEQFYYCSLIKLDNSSPFLSAWSFEALERVIYNNKANDDEKNCINGLMQILHTVRINMMNIFLTFKKYMKKECQIFILNLTIKQKKFFG